MPPLITTYSSASKRGLQGSASINVATGPVVYYDISNSSSYPGSGTTVFDLSDNGYDATIENLTYSNTAGANAMGSFGFNGVDSKFTTPVINELQLLLDAPRTFQIWARWSSNSISMPLFNKEGSSSSGPGWVFQSSSSAGAYSNIFDGTKGLGVEYGTPLAVNTWHFITWVIRPAAFSPPPSLTDKVYFNTTYKAPSLAQYANGPISESNPIRIGYYIPGGFSTVYLDGRVGAFIAYNRELSLTEITRNFNSTKTKYGY